MSALGDKCTAGGSKSARKWHQGADDFGELKENRFLVAMPIERIASERTMSGGCVGAGFSKEMIPNSVAFAQSLAAKMNVNIKAGGLSLDTSKLGRLDAELSFFVG